MRRNCILDYVALQSRMLCFSNGMPLWLPENISATYDSWWFRRKYRQTFSESVGDSDRWISRGTTRTSTCGTSEIWIRNVDSFFFRFLHIQYVLWQLTRNYLCKLCPATFQAGTEGRESLICHYSFSALALDGMGVSSTPRPLHSRETEPVPIV